MTEGNALEQLEHEMLDGRHVNVTRIGIQKLLQIRVQILKHKCQLLLCMNDVIQSHNVGMFQLLQQRYLPDRRTWNSFLLILQSYPFQRNYIAILPVLRLIDDPVRPLFQPYQPLLSNTRHYQSITFTKLFNLLVFIHRITQSILNRLGTEAKFQCMNSIAMDSVATDSIAMNVLIPVY